jgi:hypothetical protein
MWKGGMKLPFYAALNPRKPQISRKISTILDYSSIILHLTTGQGSSIEDPGYKCMPAGKRNIPVHHNV